MRHGMAARGGCPSLVAIATAVAAAAAAAVVIVVVGGLFEAEITEKEHCTKEPHHLRHTLVGDAH